MRRSGRRSRRGGYNAPVPRAVTECLAPALDHTRHQLFSPFQLGQWWRLALVGVLAGANGQAGCRFGFPGLPSSPSASTQHSGTTTWPEFPGGETVAETLAHYAWMIGLALVVLVVIFLVMLFISSVFRFILYQSVVERHCRIRPSWRRWRLAGRRFFLWHLSLVGITVMAMLVVCAVAVLILYGAGWLHDPGAHVPELIVMAVPVIAAMVLIVLLATIARVLVNDFAVPVMALEGVGALTAWRRVRETVAPKRGELAIYVLVKGVLAIAASIAFAIAAAIVIIPLAIVGAIVAVIAVLSAIALGIGWNVATVSLAVFAGFVAVAVTIAVVALLSVPVTVFFAAFSIYYVSRSLPSARRMAEPARVRADWWGRPLDWPHPTSFVASSTEVISAVPGRRRSMRVAPAAVIYFRQ